MPHQSALHWRQWLSCVIGFGTESPIHHIAFLNYFLAYSTSFCERSDEKCPIEVLCTSDMAELCHWLCVFVKEVRRDSLSQRESVKRGIRNNGIAE